MISIRHSAAAGAIALAVLNGCTQPIGTEESDQPGEQASAVTVQTWLWSDWSNTVHVKLYACAASPASPVAHPSASCQIEPDYVLIGGGASVVGNPGTGLLTASYPSDFEHGIWTGSSKDHIVSGWHQLKVSAIGLKLDGLSAAQLRAQMQLVPAVNSMATAHPDSMATVTGDTLLVGGGARTEYATGQLLTVSAPYTLGTTSWYAASKDHGISDPGKVWSYAIGVPRCPSGYAGGCLESRLTFSAESTDHTGYGVELQAPSPWNDDEDYTRDGVTTSCGSETTYSSQGRLLLTATLSPPPSSSVRRCRTEASDHVWPDSGRAYAYSLELRKRP